MSLAWVLNPTKKPRRTNSDRAPGDCSSPANHASTSLVIGPDRHLNERRAAADKVMGTDMKLSIIIPAYNEEGAIAAIIERTLAAREIIVQYGDHLPFTSRSGVKGEGAGGPRTRAGSRMTTDEARVDDVELIVVSDGSTDRTAEIASRYADIKLIVFPTNRGYGAAIQRGFEESTGEVVGFLDADGTCDPAFFAPLCSALLDEGASVAIGSRMHAKSRMPRLRRLGNRAYALILSTLSNRVVTDTASGMRVIRRDVLPQLCPLPHGLHFTPAMSARVLMDEHLKIIECPMPYEERIGQSKLHVVRDGVRFLRTIFEMSLMWRPARFFLAAALLCLSIMTVLAAHPIEMWLREGRFGEDMIYRLLFCSLLGTCGAMLLSTATLCELLQRYWEDEAAPRSFFAALLERLHTWQGFVASTALAAPLLGWLVGRGIWTRLTAGFVNLHWGRIVLAGLVAFTLVELLVTVLTANLIRFHSARKSFANPKHAAKRRAADVLASARRRREIDDPPSSAMSEPRVAESAVLAT
jgi:glycosyltransferase involved in cell wall biosynthesis